MNIISILASDAYLTVNKELAKEVGLEAAALFGELASEYMYWQQQGKIDEEGYFFSTVENVERATTLSDYQQRKALKKLSELGLVNSKRKGQPAKRYICINSELVLKFFENKNFNNLKTESEKTKELDFKFFETNNNKIIKTREKEQEKEQDINITAKAVSGKSKTTYFPLDEELNEAFKDFLEMRKKKRVPNTDRAIKLAINKLEDLSKDAFGNMDSNKAIKIIDQSILAGWTSLYPLKENNQNKAKATTNSIDWDNI